MLEIYDLRFAIDARAARGEACLMRVAYGAAHLLSSIGLPLDQGGSRLSALKCNCGSQDEIIYGSAAVTEMGVKEHKGAKGNI